MFIATTLYFLSRQRIVLTHGQCINSGRGYEGYADDCLPLIYFNGKGRILPIYTPIHIQI